MSAGFVHSIKVPRLYKAAAKVLKDVGEKRSSLKSVLYKQKHPNVTALYSLCVTAIRKSEQLNHILNKTSLLTNEPRLDPWLAKVLITELLWGKKVLKTECKPAQIILSYKEKLQEELSTISDNETDNTLNLVQKARYIRINTLLLPLDEAISYFKEKGWVLLPKSSSYTEHLDLVKTLLKPNFIQDYHIPELFVFPYGTNFQNDAKYRAGKILLHDKASCLPAKLLDPKPGSVVLDMCAAPGMKTSHLAALMNNTGKIYAVEVDAKRYGSLCQQVKATGASCVKTIKRDALSIEGPQYKDVEYILVDPSCSGTGMLDRLIMYGKEKIDPERLKQLQAFQVHILRHALLSFPNVKRVVYSTCSTNPEENEEVVDQVIAKLRDAYKLVDIKDLYKENWLHYSSREYKCSDKCLYAKPEVDQCNGFFIAIFERNVDKPLPPYTPKVMTKWTHRQSRPHQPYNKELASVRPRKRRQVGSVSKKDEESTPEQESSPNVTDTLNNSSDSVAVIEEASPEIIEEEIKHQPPAKKKKIGQNIRKAVKAKTPLARKLGKRVKMPKRIKKVK